MSTWRQYAQSSGTARAVLAFVRSAPRRWRKRAANRWADLRAVLAGYCNNTPYSAIPGEGGGYSHWRCALRRGHVERHRGLNYTWDAEGRTEYAPIRNYPRQPWERSMVLSSRQQRQRDRWLNEQYAHRKASA